MSRRTISYVQYIHVTRANASQEKRAKMVCVTRTLRSCALQAMRDDRAKREHVYCLLELNVFRMN
jgi:hypothetical protein